MANRYFNQFQYAYEKDTVIVFGNFNVGAAGAVTAGTVKGGGIVSVAKQGTAGQYLITFNDQFSQFLDFSGQTVLATASGVANVQLLQAPATLQADIKANKQITIQCVDYAGAAVNPASGEKVMFKVVYRRTSVGTYD
jgi:hypothetical protein